MVSPVTEVGANNETEGLLVGMVPGTEPNGIGDGGAVVTGGYVGGGGAAVSAVGGTGACVGVGPRTGIRVGAEVGAFAGLEVVASRAQAHPEQSHPW